MSYRVEVDSLHLIDSWPVDNAAAAVLSGSGELLATRGDTGKSYKLASVSKLISAYGALAAIEEEAVTLEDPVSIPGARIEHLLSHTSGVDFDSAKIVAAPEERRIYSNTGFEMLADEITRATDIEYFDYVQQAVLDPLGMSNTDPHGAAAGMSSTVEDLVRFTAEVLAPQLLAPATVAQATTPVFPLLDGVLPGFGVQRPNSWGLGFEIRGSKEKHWTGSLNSPETFGHFGQAGTFIWMDRFNQLAVVVLTDRSFGQWAIEAWPVFSDAVINEVRA